MTPAHAEAPAERRLPPLQALRCFSVAARTASFTRAAEELCVTQGAVSRQILLLEEFYGQPLFIRQARGLVLTEAGQLLAHTAASALEQIARTTRVLQRRQAQRDLRFMLPTCVMLWGMPLLMRFQARHPGHRLSVNTTLAHALDPERDDLGIVYDRLDSCAPHRRLLFPERLTPVCSPRLTEGAQGLRRPAQLAQQVLLHASVDHADWQRWLSAAGLEDVAAGAGLDFQTLDLANSAAVEGYGVALGDCVIAAPAIEGGRLRAPFPLEVATEHGYFLCWQADHADRPVVVELLAMFDAALDAPAAQAPVRLRRRV